jgi:hypothetical protein
MMIIGVDYHPGASLRRWAKVRTEARKVAEWGGSDLAQGASSSLFTTFNPQRGTKVPLFCWTRIVESHASAGEMHVRRT